MLHEKDLGPIFFHIALKNDTDQLTISLSARVTLSANPIKWSNILKQFVGKSVRIVWVCLTFLWVGTWRVKFQIGTLTQAWLYAN